MPRDIVVDMPKGLFGNPRRFPQCSYLELEEGACPVAAQIGIQTIHLISLGLPDKNMANQGFTTPLYNMVPDRGEVARLGVRVKGAVNTFISIKLRSDGDYGLTATVANIFSGLPVWGADVEIWGNPYDASNTPDRFCSNGVWRPGADPSDPGAYWGCAPPDIPEPFMVAPAECGVDGITKLSVRSWSNPGDDGWTVGETSPEQVTGCERLSFAPSVSVRPTTTAPDSPTGLEVDMEFPQNFNNVDGLESPPLKDARVVLPEGMTINPASADGLEACSDAQLNLKSKAPVACPLGSKIGTVEAETPVLHERLTGGMYIRAQNSDDPASGEMFRIAIVLENEERGLSVRLPGQVRVNPQTGRIETTFEDNPQLPVSKISVRLKGGSRAPLATPASCGTKTVETRLEAWSGQRVDLRDSFTIDCATGGFAPAFDAGSVSPTGG